MSAIPSALEDMRTSVQARRSTLPSSANLADLANAAML